MRAYIPIIAAAICAVFCLSVIPADFSSATEIDNDQGESDFYSYCINFQFQGSDAQWILWEFGFNDENGDPVTSTEWNPTGIVFPGKGQYSVIQTVGNSCGTYVSQLKVNIRGTPEITFSSNGGSSVPMQTVKVGNKITEPEAPVKDGYSFAGWYRDQSLLTRYSFDQPVTQHMTLYAKWVPVSTPGDDNDGENDGSKDNGKTEGSSSVLKIGSLSVSNDVLSIVVLLCGGVIAYFGNRNQNDKVRTVGFAIAALALLVMLFGIDVIGLLGLGGASQ